MQKTPGILRSPLRGKSKKWEQENRGPSADAGENCSVLGGRWIGANTQKGPVA